MQVMRSKSFLGDRRGGAVERFAIVAGALALAAMTGAHFLDVASREGGAAIYALFRKPGVDYSPTASIRKQAGQTVLDPCTGKPK